MKKTLTLLVTTTVVTAVIGVPAWSAMRPPVGTESRSFAAAFHDGAEPLQLLLVSDDDDYDHHRRSGYGYGHDNDDGDDDDDDECRGARDLAPAWSIAPPQNGLFGNGAAPQVQVN
jgi:hypothetical protein